jgi:1,4-alpha-glucan branching enzyme
MQKCLLKLIALDVEMNKERNRTPLLNYTKDVTDMATQKETVKNEAKSKGIPATKIQFAFPAPEAQKVSLGGSFNNWNNLADPMEKDKKGIWKVTVNLKPGRYEYRFIVDEKWENDPSCAGCVPNDFGSLNCVKIVE